MQIYLVGGAVRDTLLGREVTERDWVVVGATPAQLLAQGYCQVGKDFPVYLHPESKEEYALARIERKTGIGYTGFAFDASNHVTLEQDLIRRDLTINAMALDHTGALIDPFNGQADLQNKILRHVSDAFVEDPLRVFRVARFAARYAEYGFSIADETLALMSQIAESGELQSLTAERIWKETSRSLLEPTPEVYFESLKACNALQSWFAELDALWGVPNPPQYHPEVDTGIHTMLVLQQAAKLSDNLAVRFAALLHDLGKALTPKDKWPSHHGHEGLGVASVKRLCERLKVPNECKELALLTCEYHGHVHKARELKPATILNLFNQCDIWRKPERFQLMLTACTADARGRPTFETTPYPQADYLLQCYKAAEQVDVQTFLKKGLKGPKIKEALSQARITAIKAVKPID